MTAHWRYVVSRTILTGENRGEDLYEIRELYYEDDGDLVISWTKEPVEPQGESLAELRADLEHMLSALDQPILDMSLNPPALVTTPSTLTPSASE